MKPRASPRASSPVRRPRAARALPIVDAVAAPPAEAPAQPTRLDNLWFRVRATRHKVSRLLRDRREGVARSPRAAADGFRSVASSSSSPLWTHDDPRERPLVAGKIHNLRLAARRLDGALVKAGAVWSFWAEVGPPWALFGYVDGRELREGCLVPSVGGGLCQLSNALYACALDAGLEILERHAHTAKVGGAAATDRDATVFHPYVDLRFRAEVDVLVEARLVRDRLEVRLRTRQPRVPPAPRRSPASPRRSTARPLLRVDEHACDACARADCEVGEDARARIRPHRARTAFAVDELTPELAAFVAARARLKHTSDDAEDDDADVLALPVPGALVGMPQYAWDTRGFDVVAAPLVALARSRRMRALASEGAARVRAQLDCDAALAAAYARFFGASVEHLVVAHSLLPHLWRSGDLAGRTFDAFLTRLPLFALQARLDEAAARFPDDPLLRAYRAPSELVEAERDALAAAAKLFTPHPEIARVLPRATLVPWSPPPPSSPARIGGRRIVFPGPAAARKGAHAVRAAARALGLVVVLCGSDLEGPSFWDGVEVERMSFGRAFRRAVRAVVQPALVEDRPRRLLEAVARGVPVIATRACGVPGAVEVPFGDVAALITALAHRPGQTWPASTHTGTPEGIAQVI